MNRESIYWAAIGVASLIGVLGIARGISTYSKPSNAAVYENIGVDLKRDPESRIRLNTFPFRDSPRKNALIVLPASDYNGAFDSDSQVIARSIIEDQYDTKILIADSEEDILQSDISSIDLLFISGHGNQVSIRFGEDNCECGGCDETKTLDLYDEGLIYCLAQKLKTDATIVLDSCSTAEGGKESKNLANLVADISGKMVVAATEPVTRIYIDPNSPLEIRMFNCNRDVTYVVDGKRSGAHKHRLNGAAEENGEEYDL